MPGPFSSFFHRFTKNQPGPRLPDAPEHWPAAWKTIEYKTYPRFATIPLPPADISASLVQAVSVRESKRTFSGQALSLADLSAVLRYSVGLPGGDATRRRAYPSGGNRYPLETYVLVLKHGELLVGLYHYDVKNHGLSELTRDLGEIPELFLQPWPKEASAIVFLTAVFDRTVRKYGERGYRLVLFEAGHAAQNMYLCAAGLGISCCALGGVYDERVEALIDIDGVTESLVYALALG